MLILIFIFLFAVDGFSSPFCVVTSTGKNCWYSDANECRKMAIKLGGMCVYEDAEQKSNSQPNYPAPVPYAPPGQVPTPAAPVKIYGLNPTPSLEAAEQATEPFKKIERDRQIKQESQRAENDEINAESELLRMQGEYFRSQLHNSNTENDSKLNPHPEKPMENQSLDRQYSDMDEVIKNYDPVFISLKVSENPGTAGEHCIEIINKNNGSNVNVYHLIIGNYECGIAFFWMKNYEESKKYFTRAVRLQSEFHLSSFSCLDKSIDFWNKMFQDR